MRTQLALFFTGFFILTNSFCQERQQRDFQDKIENSNWYVEDSLQLEDYEMMVVSIDSDSISQVYVNWIEGMSSNRCSYSTAFTKDYFWMELGGCRYESTEIKYVYGFLTFGKDDALNLLFSERKFDSKKDLMEQKDWIRFDRMVD